MINRIVNSYFAAIAGTLRDIKDIITAVLGLNALDQNSARREFCNLMYNCKPAIDLIFPYINEDVVNWYTRNDKFVTPDLSEWGIPPMTFNSKYEVFEYFACRLSLSQLFNNFADKMIGKLMDFILSYRQYLTLDWFLQNTMPGRVLSRFVKDYEDFFNEYIFPVFEKLEPYLNCSFALCDFGASTTNFFEDFKTKYYFGINSAPNPVARWVLFKDDLFGSLKDYSDGALQDLDQINPTRLSSGQNLDGKNPATTPYTKEEEEMVSSNSTTNKSVLAKSEPLASVSRRVISILTPNSVEGALGVG
jgi:hypothetical protein